MVREAFQTAIAVLLSLGGGGGLVLALSGWLGKVWASRLMAQDRAQHETDLERLRAELLARHSTQLEHLKTDLELAKTKLLAAHYDKVALYRHAIDIIAPMVAKVNLLVQAKKAAPAEVAQHLLAFETDRLRAYGYLAMFAPQAVMNAFDSTIDYLLDVTEEKTPFEFRCVRTTGLAFLNEVRRDLGIDASTIQYLGARQER